MYIHIHTYKESYTDVTFRIAMGPILWIQIYVSRCGIWKNWFFSSVVTWQDSVSRTLEIESAHAHVHAHTHTNAQTCPCYTHTKVRKCRNLWSEEKEQDCVAIALEILQRCHSWFRGCFRVFFFFEFIVTATLPTIPSYQRRPSSPRKEKKTWDFQRICTGLVALRGQRLGARQRRTAWWARHSKDTANDHLVQTCLY